mmetsp:Transcript_9921/g.16330  ORF Transcript_9921/g.16330 Transcript_9921/m.16330 type:complete len:537 (-) Transcript_9921:543-2153(-)
MLGRGKKKTKSKKVVVDLQNPAAIKIQSMMRVFMAKVRIRRQAKQVWQRVYDPTYKKYFWYNTLDETSKWTLPMYVDAFTAEDHLAQQKLEKIIRGFMGRMKARRKANEKYTRFYDSNQDRFYWLDKTTGETTWTVTPWLRRQNIEMPPEDQMLYDSQQRIKELEEALKAKDKEIKDVRKKRFEELEPEVIKDKVENAKSFKRSKHMDEWRTDELGAWFTELKMDEYVPFLFQNRVDGLLFINLAEEEWPDMGITNKFHVRKLQLILKSYRIRYQRRKDHVEGDEDDELLSEVSPSELSALIRAEEAGEDGDFSSDDSDDDRSYDSEDELRKEMTPEERQQRELDAKNIKIDLNVRGDAVNFPMIGDIVRVRYVTTLVESDKVVMSTKNVLGRPWVEFVLGIEQVIKGFDRAIPQMSVGERSTITISPEYGYGEAGLPPHIPPNSSLSFDLTLLGFRPRTPWVKPLIQDTSTNEKPYHADLKIYNEMMHRDSTASSSVSASAAGTPLKGMNAPSALLMAGGGDDASTNNQLAKLKR